MQKILKWAFFIIGLLGVVASVALSIYIGIKTYGLYTAANSLKDPKWFPVRWTILTICVALVTGFFLGLATAWPRKKKTEAERAQEAEKAATKAAEQAEKAAAKATAAEVAATPRPPDPAPVTPAPGGLKVTPLPED
jgi:NhaP-type Na+/H+ or K+/H+ antiporter